MLQQMTELGTPPRPKRDASRTISAWPLHRRALPCDPGYIPHCEFGQRLPYRLGPARVGLDFISFSLLIKSHRLRLSYKTCDSHVILTEPKATEGSTYHRGKA